LFEFLYHIIEDIIEHLRRSCIIERLFPFHFYRYESSLPQQRQQQIECGPMDIGTTRYIYHPWGWMIEQIYIYLTFSLWESDFLEDFFVFYHICKNIVHIHCILFSFYLKQKI
jgi:hypothetical protein